ncbi:MAG: hypothetical protein R3C53_13115 [Pirellulaceae bacterium]
MRIISVTDGRSGHHELAPDRLVDVRRREARAAGERVGAEYEVWQFPDELPSSQPWRFAVQSFAKFDSLRLIDADTSNQ